MGDHRQRWPPARIAGLAVVICFALGSRLSAGSEVDSWKERRQAMVALVSHYSPEYKVSDPRVLAAMRKVPRHEFVPEDMRARSYDDSPLPIGEGQTISQPLIVGYMTQALELKRKDRVLEIGTGSGYQAAILAELVEAVYSIEILPALAERAEATLKRLGYKNVLVRAGDGYLGWPQKAPFDAVIVTCAPDHIPKPLVDQLKVGGRLIIPLGDEISGVWSAQELIVIRKTARGMRREKHFDVRFVPMLGEAQKHRGAKDPAPATQKPSKSLVDPENASP